MSTQFLLSRAYLAWFVVASLLGAITLGLAFQDEALWKAIPFALAYLGLVRGAGCFYCKRAREVMSGQKETIAAQPEASTPQA